MEKVTCTIWPTKRTTHDISDCGDEKFRRRRNFEDGRKKKHGLRRAKRKRVNMLNRRVDNTTRDREPTSLGRRVARGPAKKTGLGGKEGGGEGKKEREVSEVTLKKSPHG